MNYFTKKLFIPSASAAMIVLSGCSSTAVNNELVSSAEQHFNQTAGPNSVREYAPLKYEQAKESLQKLKSAAESDADESRLEHLAYMSRKHSEIALQQAKLKKAEKSIQQAEVNRKDLLLALKSEDLEQTKQRADQLASEKQQAQSQLEQMKAKNNQMAQLLNELKAKETERGLVLTLDSILFELNKATLKSGSERSVDKLAEFLKSYPDRNLLVEGFTDSTGKESYNQQLSRDRAEAIQSELIAKGVSPERIEIKGYGEQFPVATNETRAGRQMNRRVEVIVANKGDDLIERRR